MGAVIPSQAFLAAFLPIARASLSPSVTAPITKRLPLLHRLRSSILSAAFLPIPGIIETIWEGILKAVPKKKTSHMKKRHRFMAGKALKDVTSLNKCSSCGRLKRAHVLCPHCVASIRSWFVDKLGAGEKIKEEEDTLIQKLNPQLNLISRRRRAVMAEKIKAHEQRSDREGGQYLQPPVK